MKKSEELRLLVKEMFEIMDEMETNDEGRDYYPTSIRSSSVRHAERLALIIPRLKELSAQPDTGTPF